MPESVEENAPPIQRLCTEIQLFDLCDKDRCSSRSGRFCTDADMLVRFERIAEEDAVSRCRQTCAEGDEDFDEDGAGFDDAFDASDEGEYDCWDDE